MFVRPAPDPGDPGKRLRVRDPDLKDFLPDEGREVPETPHWHRLLHVYRDVERVDPPKAKAVTKSAEA